jgi:hypothetical protein
MAKDSKAFTSISNRVNEAEKVHSDIRRFAYGKEVDTRMPEGVSLPSGGSEREIVHADAADDAARVMGVDGLSGLLKMKDEGVNTADPESVVRNAWQMAPNHPSAQGGYMGYQKAVQSPNAKKSVGEFHDDRLRELTTSEDFRPFRSSNGLTVRSRPDKVFNALTVNRSGHFSGQLAPWYEGHQTGETTPEGAPIYAEGESVKVVKEIAARAGVDPAVARRATAMGSMKSVWSKTDRDTGITTYPNAEGATEQARRAIASPHKSIQEVTKPDEGGDVVRAVLGPRRELIAEMARGEHSAPTEMIKPAKSDPVPTAKQSNFDVGLTSPHSERYGYSSWVAAERSKAFTSDTHDLKAAGVKTPSKPVYHDDGTPKLDKDGNPVKSNAGEKWVGKPSGYDISRGSAVTMLADQFSERMAAERESGGEEAATNWARRNAHIYTPNNAQADMWVNVRGRA